MAAVHHVQDKTYLPGQSPADRRGQTVTVTVAFALTCIFLCLVTRFYMRWPISKLTLRNDGLAVASTVFAVGQAAAVSVAVSHNFGHPIEDVSAQDLTTCRRSLLVGQLLFYLSASFASMSVVEFIVALKGHVGIWLVDWVARLITPVWGVAGVIVAVVFLGLSTTTMPAAAPIVLAVVGSLIQLATFTTVVLIARDLKTDRNTKLRVLLGFSPAFLVVAGFIVSTAVAPTILFGDQFTTADVSYVITLQCILLLLIIYATTPALLQIGRRFQTGYNVPVIDVRHNTMSGSVEDSSRRRGPWRSGSYGLKGYENQDQQVVSSVSAQDRKERSRSRPDLKPKRGKSTNLKSPSRSGEADGISVESDSSRKIIISKTVEQSSVNI